MLAKERFVIPESAKMKKLLLFVLVFAEMAGVVFPSASAPLSSKTAEILQFIAEGSQEKAEIHLRELLKANPEDMDGLFLSAVAARSRFAVGESAQGFAKVLYFKPESPEGLASACILGIDFSDNEATALYYFNALLMVCEQNPESIPLHWMAGTMARTLTNGNGRILSPEVRHRILQCGIREYDTVLSLMAPCPGPVLVHQTLANLLDDTENYDMAGRHREAAVGMERKPWSLHAAAFTFLKLGRDREAWELIKEAVSMEPGNATYNEMQGHVLWHLGLRREAIDSWQRAAELEPENEGYSRLCAMGYRHLGEYVAAREWTRQILERNPQNRLFQLWDARLTALLGEPGAGERVFKAGTLDFKGSVIGLKKSSDPWFCAVDSGDIGEVRKMLGNVDINKRDVSDANQTALMKAAASGWEPIADELIRAGADLDAVDANGDTALHYSADFEEARVMKLLLDAGAKMDLQDKWGQTPLIMCASDQNWDGFCLLMEKRADVGKATPRGGTALHYAAGHGDMSMVKALLERGERVDAPIEKSGETPLIVACREWAHSYIMEPLLVGGADVNARDKEGKTALYHAVDPLPNLPLVELLLDHGANPLIPDNQGVTPITKARRLGWEDMAARMEKKSGRQESFQIALPDALASSGEADMERFLLPVLYAQGYPSEPVDLAMQPGHKKEAVKVLRRMFGVGGAAELQEKIHNLREFQPTHRMVGELPFDKLNTLIKGAIWKIQSTCKSETQDDAAWAQAHVLFLASLGVRAEYLAPEEGQKLIRNAMAILKGRFSTWADFSKSFVLGAKTHEGWDAARYGQICTHLDRGSVSSP